MADPEIRLLVDGTAVAAAVQQQLTSIEVRESDAEPTLLALRFTLAHRADGEFAPLDDELFVPGAAVAFEVAAPGGLPRRLFDGYVTHLRPHFETLAANAYLEVLAMDAAVVLGAEDRAASWPGATDGEVAEQIFRSYGLQVDVASTAVHHDEDRQLLVQRASDWAFLQMLAARNGARCYLEYDDRRGTMVGHFHPPDIAATPQPDVVIAQADACLRWVDIQLVATGPVRVLGAALDPIGKQIVRGDGTPELAVFGGDDAANAVEAGLQRGGAAAATALLADPFPSDEAIAVESTAATDTARLVVELRAELDPALYRGILRARRPVLVRGVGRRFSGVYWVESVRTTVASEGQTFLQTFVARRNATAPTGREPVGQSAEELPAA